ncbi:MAG: hypothetical protein AB7T48_04475 [Solirubrobacterales bacterium]
MNEERLKTLLREAPIPASEEVERRGLEVVEAAYAARQPGHSHVSLPRLAIALAVVALLGALLLSPAGAAVRDWVDDAFTTQVKRQGPGLAEIPGGGRLLVQSRSGPWVVQADGSRRLLGDFDTATWSPHGLYVAAAAGHTLTALEPDGTPRWSLTASGRVFGPRWSPSAYPYRIAYRSGNSLRVTAADGTGDHPVAPRVAAVSPAWSPFGLPQLAYVDTAGRLRIADSESGKTLAKAPALAAVQRIEWASSGVLLEASRTALRMRTVETDKLGAGPTLGPASRLALPRGTTAVYDTALHPGGKTIAALLGVRSRLGPRTHVVLYAGGGGNRRLFNAPGRLSEIAWAPRDGSLLIAWPSADQWLFLPTGRGEGRSVADVASAFAPGERRPAFPRVEGWCCGQP